MTQMIMKDEGRILAPLEISELRTSTNTLESTLPSGVWEAVPPDDTAAPMEPLAQRLVDDSELNLRFSIATSVSAAAAALRAVKDLIRDFSPGTDGTAADEVALISHISLLEDIKSATAAAQARATHAFIKARAAREREMGMPLAERGRGVGAEIALARRQSPHAGSQATRMAYTLCERMPHALAALNDGRLSEFSASVAVKEVSALSPTGQTTIDEKMRDRYGHAGPRRLAGEVRALANQADPVAQVKRRHIAVGERRVTVRPAPDSMAYLTALLPVEQAFACKKALLDGAATTASGESEVTRSGAQAEADLLVERLTGQSSAQAIRVELNIVMTDTSVFGTSRHELASSTALQTIRHVSRNTADTAGSHADVALNPVDDDGRLAEAVHASAWIPGFGPIPAPIARDLLRPDHDPPDERARSRVFLRRVLTDPVTGDITAMDTRRRAFTGALRRALIVRDDHCRVPWCGAPIVHLDHTHPYARGGRTNAANGAGLCARCNYTKEYPGWEYAAQLESDRVVTTPTGHSYESVIPPLVPELTARRTRT